MKGLRTSASWYSDHVKEKITLVLPSTPIFGFSKHVLKSKTPSNQQTKLAKSPSDTRQLSFQPKHIFSFKLPCILWQNITNVIRPMFVTTNPDFLRTAEKSFLSRAFVHDTTFFRYPPTSTASAAPHVSPPYPQQQTTWTVGQDVEVYWNSYW